MLAEHQRDAKPLRLPSIRTLEAFVAAAQLGSLASAAARVAMSVPALSRRIAALENELGVRLFDRIPRGVVPTAAGRGYLVHATAVLDRLRTAAAELRGDAAIVRVTTIPSFATRWLLPRLPGFLAAHPGIEVDVRTSIPFERMEAGAYDFAIRLAPERDAGAEARLLLPIHLMPVWSTAHPIKLERPTDILDHPLLGPDHRPEFWTEWLRLAGLDEKAARPRSVDALLLYDRVLGGAGIGIGIEPLMGEVLHHNRLLGMTSHRFRSERSLFLIPAPGSATPEARAFGEWVMAEAQVEPMTKLPIAG